MNAEETRIKTLIIELLREAIKDIQSIISNQDLKARFLLAVNLAIVAISILPLKVMYSDCLEVSSIEILLLVIFTFLITVYNLYLIFQLINKVINPRINPQNFVKNTPSESYKDIFFPMLRKENCFNFDEYNSMIQNI